MPVAAAPQAVYEPLHLLLGHELRRRQFGEQVVKVGHRRVMCPVSGGGLGQIPFDAERIVRSRASPAANHSEWIGTHQKVL